MPEGGRPTRTFIDTNVLVYAVDEAEPAKRDRAREVLRELDASELVISTQVLGEFYVVATRRLQQPLEAAIAAEAVRGLIKLAVVGSDSQLILDGIAISTDSGISYWDGLIVAAARTGGCDRLLTEDLAPGSTIASVRIENPFDGLR